MTKKLTNKRTYKSTETFKPYDGTHGFTLTKEVFKDGSRDYKISCRDCKHTLEVYTHPDLTTGGYPMVEVGGVMLGLDTAVRLFTEIFNNCKASFSPV